MLVAPSISYPPIGPTVPAVPMYSPVVESRPRRSKTPAIVFLLALCVIICCIVATMLFPHWMLLVQGFAGWSLDLPYQALCRPAGCVGSYDDCLIYRWKALTEVEQRECGGTEFGQVEGAWKETPATRSWLSIYCYGNRYDAQGSYAYHCSDVTRPYWLLVASGYTSLIGLLIISFLVIRRWKRMDYEEETRSSIMYHAPALFTSAASYYVALPENEHESEWMRAHASAPSESPAPIGAALV